MNDTVRRRQIPGLLFFAGGALLVIAACGILASHARLFGQKRDTAVMVGTQLPELKTSVALLAASVEAEQIFTQQALAAREEQASAYVLPQGSPVRRGTSAIQEVAVAVGGLQLQTLAFAKATEDHGSSKTIGGSFVVTGNFANFARMLAVLGYGGDMMVRDVIPVADQQEFLRQMEVASPLSLRGAEDLLYLDLAEYAADPDKREMEALVDISTDTQSDIRTVLLSAGLAGVREALGPVAKHLKQQSLWPLPLMRIDTLSRSGDRWTVQFTLFSR